MSAQRTPTGTPAAMRNIFGIIMIIIYVGVGILFFCGYFDILFPTWKWVRWAGGIMFTLYGLWRAYRQFKGIDPGYGNDRDDQ
ncbi:MAG: hypothetical protein K2H17_03355 [Duncaniella sp.]|uniref:hypothetical protein n=1 Tax=Duncaniella sp. TaxID=2518496 RepID=UPI0023BD05D3|nr:hypothetical protein [Duncaniella sp.]MDE5988415.1 hypothetical protein [Duncaniella sp.]